MGKNDSDGSKDYPDIEDAIIDFQINVVDRFKILK